MQHTKYYSRAAHQVLLACSTPSITRVQHTKYYSRAAHQVLLACSTPSITHVQHTKYYSRAAHEVLLACFLQSCSTLRWISCSAQNIACVLYTKVNSRVTCKFRLSHSTKIEEHMCVAERECQLRCKRYRMYILEHGL